MSPHVNEHGVWSVSCPHDACQGRHKLEFLEEMLSQKWFPEECLSDEEFLLPDDDDVLPKQSQPETKPNTLKENDDPLPLSAPLWDKGLVTDGFCARKDADTVRWQIQQNLRDRVSYVITEGGKAKLFIHPKKGALPMIWDDTALTKFYRNNGVFYTEKGAKKKKPTKIDPANLFATDPLRVTYEGTQFEPDASRADPHKYNTFNGFPVEPVKGDWSLLAKHIRDNLIAGNASEDYTDDQLFNWFMTWMADLFQNPGHKMGTSVAVCGEQGTGKSKLFDWLSRALGDYATKVSTKKHLVGNFNGHLDSKLLVVAEEAFWSGDKEAAGVLKDLITSATYMAERKGLDAVERPNYIRTAFVTNNKWAIPTDDNADARRFFVIKASDSQKQNGAYFAAIDNQMKNGGLEAMVYDLMHWDPTEHNLTWDCLRSAPWTPARAEQAGYSASAGLATLLQIVEDGYFTDRDGIDVVLSEKSHTRVMRPELVESIRGKETHGGARKAPKDAIVTLLGKAVWHDLKHTFGGGERERYVEFPPLNQLREDVAKKYR